MSYAEHLIENALLAIEEKGLSEEAWNQFRNHHATEAMSEATGIKPEYVWDMATYVVLSWMQNTGWEFEDDSN